MLKIVGGMEVYGFALFGLGTYLHRVHRRHGAWKRGGEPQQSLLPSGLFLLETTAGRQLHRPPPHNWSLPHDVGQLAHTP